MNKEKRQYPNPRFANLEEEDNYWQTHSALDEGYEETVQVPKQTRASFLSVRLTGEELNMLREVAEAFHTTPSALARGGILDSVVRFRSMLAKQKEQQKELEDDIRSGQLWSSANKRLTYEKDPYDEMRNKIRILVDQTAEEHPKALRYLTDLLSELLLVRLAGGPDEMLLHSVDMLTKHKGTLLEQMEKIESSK